MKHLLKLTALSLLLSSSAVWAQAQAQDPKSDADAKAKAEQGAKAKSGQPDFHDADSYDDGIADATEAEQDGDDPLTRKRPGRVKYGDITLKKGMKAAEAEKATEKKSAKKKGDNDNQ